MFTGFLFYVAAAAAGRTVSAVAARGCRATSLETGHFSGHPAIVGFTPAEWLEARGAP
ncbi:hypothetical protein STRAU_1653 [Streptomyces aurantiacus JA 4570]|uniref:Uncharacterized protein n=1 Tax=Streptomyces aurantiacus JA 4570 TaxID=1286094 RepID=S3ZR12_9ACTN|nr:hypothetical protein STRAU_1653 [Streptomyces aurantiacus JA 4570]